VILDQELGGIARVLLGIAEQAAGDHQVSGKDGRAALADDSLGHDERFQAVPMQAQRRVGPGRAAPYDECLGSQLPHLRRGWYDGCIALRACISAKARA
jgi:hypothetical protein